MSASRIQWNPQQYAANSRFVSELGMPVVELSSPQLGEFILDLGCGDGALTLKLVRLGCKVMGIDSSQEMIAAAQELGLNVQVMDGHILPFTDEFDAVFSNAALHWMKNPEQVIAGVWRALKPGGRFVGEFGGFGNVAAIVSAIESALAARDIVGANPWFFPSSDEYRALLQARGCVVTSLALIPRPTRLPGEVGSWIETFAKPISYFCQKPNERTSSPSSSTRDAQGSAMLTDIGSSIMSAYGFPLSNQSPVGIPIRRRRPDCLHG